MSLFEWAQVAQMALMAAVTGLVWWWGRERQNAVDVALIHGDLKSLALRVDRAGEKVSDLATRVQGLPDYRAIEDLRARIAALEAR